MEKLTRQEELAMLAIWKTGNGFVKEVDGDSVKYMKGPFRIVIVNNNFSDIEMWYREDRRHFNSQIGVHHLQNLYHNMTKVPLEMP